MYDDNYGLLSSPLVMIITVYFFFILFSFDIDCMLVRPTIQLQLQLWLQWLCQQLQWLKKLPQCLPTCHPSVVSLLDQGYSDHQIQAKTNIGRQNVGRSAKEVENNKKNNLGGHPSKLSTCNKAPTI